MIGPENLKTWLTERSLKPSAKYLVAVSGGLDSMSLLHLCIKAQLDAQVAHVNYGLREKESDLDEQLVLNYCEEHDIDCHVSRWTPNEAGSGSVQMQCREHRYAFFNKLMDENGLDATLLAHHADDNIETILLNLFKGTGLDGLTGIPEHRERYLRPLLSISRTQLEEYVSANDIPFRNDVSNFENKYDRNFIRNEVIPVIKDRFQMADQSILRTSSNLGSAQELLAGEAERLKAKFVQDSTDRISVNLDELKSQAGHKFLLFNWMKPFGFNSTQCSDILGVQGNSAEFASRSHRAIYDRGILEIVSINSVSSNSKGFDVSAPPLGWSAKIFSRSANWKPDTASNSAEIDIDKIDTNELKIRSWEAGDRFKPLGMDGWKKLSDLFVDEKLSILDKERVQVLTSGDDIVWVVGIRMDDRFKVNKATRTVLRLMYQA